MLDATSRPLTDLRAMLVDVICLMARNDFPLAVPPRRLAELFDMVNRVVFLETLAENWSLEPFSDMDPACQTYLSALARNVENDQRQLPCAGQTAGLGADSGAIAVLRGGNRFSTTREGH